MSKVLYCHDNFYLKHDDGRVYSAGQFPYEYWRPFLENFDELKVTGRYFTSPESHKKHNISSGDGVSFALYPNINSPLGLLKHIKNVDKQVEALVTQADAVVIRAVSDIGWLAYRHAKRMGKPIAMEMAACAWDSTWNHGNQLGKIYAFIRYARAREITANADYVLYVTNSFLQNRYPTKGVSSSISNVRIDSVDPSTLNRRKERIKKIYDRNDLVNIGLIGNLDNKIKGVADALKAISVISKNGASNFAFHHLGPGNPEPYQQLANEYNISDKVTFHGMQKTGKAVFEWLKQIDLYLQPSYQEGLPRATIEAMSLGCPVLASTAGGIPELIDRESLVKPGDTSSLAKLISSALRSPEWQMNTAEKNLSKSKEFTSDILVPRRQEFWHSFAEFSNEKNKGR